MALAIPTFRHLLHTHTTVTTSHTKQTSPHTHTHHPPAMHMDDRSVETHTQKIDAKMYESLVTQLLTFVMCLRHPCTPPSTHSSVFSTTNPHNLCLSFLRQFSLRDLVCMREFLQTHGSGL
eukprot:GDKI01036896.1.p1 GENE.GDKI01036896.1~~GDKI01036896.1.p1  ORF type:complete len:132 (-),score=35.47 GDKI01036896.1:16-378(-)